MHNFPPHLSCVATLPENILATGMLFSVGNTSNHGLAFCFDSWLGDMKGIPAPLGPNIPVTDFWKIKPVRQNKKRHRCSQVV